MSQTTISAWMWEGALDQFENTEAAPVSAFEHAPLADVWKTLCMKNTVAEVSNAVFSPENINENLNVEATSHWFVEIVKNAGYYVQVRCLGYPESQADEVDKKMVWVHYSDLKEIGYYMKNNVDSMPPFPINSKRDECIQLLSKSMVGRLSVNELFRDPDIINRGRNNRWSIGQKVEVRDKDCVSHLRVGYVKRRKGGRIWVCYWDSRGKAKDSYWVHEDSEFIKPEGWSITVGGKINAPAQYTPALLKEDLLEIDTGVLIEEGMFFEMINPIRLNEIAVGKVTKVLQRGYFKCRIESVLHDVDLREFLKGENEFLFHITSNYIFPCGTCAEYGQNICAPASVENDGEEKFSWELFFAATGQKALPVPERKADKQALKLKQGMWIEAVDSHVTEMVCPANVYAVMGPYAVKVRFPGWPQDYDQWKPMNSTELFPIGWSKLVGHPLAPPGTEITDFAHVFDYGDNNTDMKTEDESETQEEKRPLVENKNTGKRGHRTRAKPAASPAKSPTKKRSGGKRKKRGATVTSESENELENGLISVSPSAKARKSTSGGKRARVSSNLQSDTLAVKAENVEGQGNSRRSARSRAAPAFFGNNVDTRHTKLIP